MEQVINKFVVFVELDGRRTHRNHKHAIQLQKEGKGTIEGAEQQIEQKPIKKHSKKHKK